MDGICHTLKIRVSTALASHSALATAVDRLAGRDFGLKYINTPQ